MEFTFNLLLCSFFRLRPGHWTLNFPMRPYWRLYWVDQPGCHVCCHARTFELTPDDLTLIAPDTYYEGDVATPLNQFCIHFTCDELFDTSALTVHQVRNELWIPEFCRRVRELEHRFRFRHRDVPFLLQAISNAMASIPSEFILTEAREPRLEAVIAAMKCTHAPVLCNDDLAEIAGMSKRAFLRSFKEVLGVTPQVWYLRRRLERAMMELEFSARSIDEIAAATGFCDRNYFSAVFRKHFSTSPAKYRRECLRGSDDSI